MQDFGQGGYQGRVFGQGGDTAKSTQKSSQDSDEILIGVGVRCATSEEFLSWQERNQEMNQKLIREGTDPQFRI